MERVNLIPKELRIKLTVQFKSKVLVRNVMYLPLIVLLLYFLIAIPKFVKIQTLKNKLKISEQTLDSTKNKLEDFTAGHNLLQGEIDQWEKKIQLIRKQKDSIEEELTGAKRWSDVLIELSRVVPKETWLNNIVLNKGILTLEGATFSNSEVSAFLKNLQSSPLFVGAEFKSTELKELQDRKEKVIEFQIIGKLY
ncbi:MAG: PilN domain-containing protein [Candidatus Omnitrophota bacterium]